MLDLNELKQLITTAALTATVLFILYFLIVIFH